MWWSLRSPSKFSSRQALDDDECLPYLELCVRIGVAEVAKGCSAEQSVALAHTFPVLLILWLAEIVGFTGKQVIDALGDLSEHLALCV